MSPHLSLPDGRRHDRTQRDRADVGYGKAISHQLRRSFSEFSIVRLHRIAVSLGVRLRDLVDKC
jgi:hypothetical protein